MCVVMCYLSLLSHEASAFAVDEQIEDKAAASEEELRRAKLELEVSCRIAGCIVYPLRID